MENVDDFNDPASDHLYFSSPPALEENNQYVHGLELLKNYFGYTTFRSQQWNIIENALDGKDQVVNMSTGTGKSICYQLPALIQDKITLVICPLISLMENQAHCVFLWGKEFRHSYRHISSIRDIIPNAPIMALTATATKIVIDDLIDNLKLRKPVITATDVNRQNLSMEVFKKTVSMNKNTSYDRDLAPYMVRELNKPSHFGGPAIIYCQTRNEVDNITCYLKRLGFMCASYHAGQNRAVRTKSCEDFQNDKVSTIVATIAFGMGIDKPNIRHVFHYGTPSNIESYYQEIGRAGRDGLPSSCRLFYNKGDIVMHRNRIKNSLTSMDYKSHALLMLDKMVQFCETVFCRRKLLLEYFGSSDVLPKQRNCCDICSTKETIPVITIDD